MIAVFAALTLASQPTPPLPHLAAAPVFRLDPMEIGSRGACASYSQTRQVRLAGLRKLADLPDANLEIAVARVYAGCPVPMIVRYEVSR